MSGLRDGLVAVLSMLCVYVLLCGVLSYRSYREFSKAEEQMWAGQTRLAKTHYRHAVRFYAPGNPFPRRALDALERLALSAEEQKQPQNALRTWRHIRASIASIESFYTPYADLLQRADERIAALLPKPPPGMLQGVAASRIGLVPLGFVVGGFGLWIFGVFQWIGDRQRVWSAVAVLGFGAFIGGMCFA